MEKRWTVFYRTRAQQANGTPGWLRSDINFDEPVGPEEAVNHVAADHGPPNDALAMRVYPSALCYSVRADWTDPRWVVTHIPHPEGVADTRPIVDGEVVLTVDEIAERLEVADG